MIVLRTIHGSRLYGNASASSDYDYYEVRTDIKRYRQKITGSDDVHRVPLSVFMHHCQMGVPQALEAMFSEKAEIDLFPALRSSYRVGEENVHHKFLRTIKAFALINRYEGGKTAKKLMKRRHSALRLIEYLESMSEYGRFNPTLSETQLLKLDTIMKTRSSYYTYIEQYVSLEPTKDSDYGTDYRPEYWEHGTAIGI